MGKIKSYSLFLGPNNKMMIIIIIEFVKDFLNSGNCESWSDEGFKYTYLICNFVNI